MIVHSEEDAHYSGGIRQYIHVYILKDCSVLLPNKINILLPKKYDVTWF